MQSRWFQTMWLARNNDYHKIISKIHSWSPFLDISEGHYNCIFSGMASCQITVKKLLIQPLERIIGYVNRRWIKKFIYTATWMLNQTVYGRCRGASSIGSGGGKSRHVDHDLHQEATSVGFGGRSRNVEPYIVKHYFLVRYMFYWLLKIMNSVLRRFFVKFVASQVHTRFWKVCLGITSYSILHARQSIYTNASVFF